MKKRDILINESTPGAIIIPLAECLQKIFLCYKHELLADIVYPALIFLYAAGRAAFFIIMQYKKKNDFRNEYLP